MNKTLINIILSIIFIFTSDAFSQESCTNPLPPILSSVTFQPETDTVEMVWALSPSPDVEAYIINGFEPLNANPDFYPIDTIFKPDATNYRFKSTLPGSFSIQYNISAWTSPDCESQSLNIINTIFCRSEFDTCRKEILISWNPYPDYPKCVLEYNVLAYVNESILYKSYKASSQSHSLIISDFEADSKYCFVVEAVLEGGGFSSSNKSCLFTKMQRPPKWINADYATVNNDKKIELSFHIDPLSEIKTFRLERKTGNTGNFSQIAQFTISAPSVSYVDNKADISEINYYRLAALNNCGITVIWSNPASNIVLACDQNGDEIRLAWNSYRGWTGGISSYKLFTNTGDGFKEIETISPDDTLFIIKYSDIMFDVTGNEVCFILKALEGSNPYSDPGESSSPAVCIPASVVITVPDIFTPDGNGINDLFSPVLSFTPDEYYLLITDLRRRKVFESRNFNDKWDGRINGSSLPGGVYLWLLETRAPGGEKMTRSGTVTIVFNR